MQTPCQAERRTGTSTCSVTFLVQGIKPQIGFVRCGRNLFPCAAICAPAGVANHLRCNVYNSSMWGLRFQGLTITRAIMVEGLCLSIMNASNTAFIVQSLVNRFMLALRPRLEWGLAGGVWKAAALFCRWQQLQQSDNRRVGLEQRTGLGTYRQCMHGAFH